MPELPSCATPQQPNFLREGPYNASRVADRLQGTKSLTSDDSERCTFSSPDRPATPCTIKSKEQYLNEEPLEFGRGLGGTADSFQQFVRTELASMNEKLDKLVTNMDGRAEQISWRPAPLSEPVTSTTIPKDVSFLDRSQESAAEDLRLSNPVDKFKGTRTKIRFISAMMASQKTSSKSVRTRGTGGTPSNSLATFMRPIWDEEAAAHMKEIQRVLANDRSKQTCRSKLWQLSESPFSSRMAFTYAWLSNIIVIASVPIALVESTHVNMGLEILFAAEFILRLACCPHPFRFLVKAFTWIDILSVVPLGLRLRGASDHEHVITLAPMLRLMKLMRRFEMMRLMFHAFSLACEALPFLLYTLALIAIVFAEIFCFLEPSSNIGSLPEALWFTIVTMTTVGYGDITPVTTEGNVAASVLMVFSALYMAMPLGIVGDAFSRVWADRDRLLVIKRFRGAFLEGGFTLQSFENVFRIFDKDASGALDIDEFTDMVTTMQMRMTEERINNLFAILDKDGAGQITLDALKRELAPKALTTQILAQGAEQASTFIRQLSPQFTQQLAQSPSLIKL